MRFLWDLFWNPVWALDMMDPTTRRPAYSKVLGLFAFMALFFLAMVEIFLPDTRPLSAVKWSLIFAAPFGVLGLRTWFANKKEIREATERETPPTEPNIYTDDERGE